MNAPSPLLDRQGDLVGEGFEEVELLGRDEQGRGGRMDPSTPAMPREVWGGR